MDQVTVAKILFAETKTLRPDASAPKALSNARCALATAIGSADGVGYWPPVEPAAIELASEDSQHAWNDCLAAANRAPVQAVVGTICVFDDQSLSVAKSISTLNAVVAGGPQSTFGPFRALTGELRYLQLFANQAGIDPGRYPRDGSHPVTAAPMSGPASGLGKVAAQVRHGKLLGVALLAFVAALGWVGYFACNRGIALTDVHLAETAAWTSPNREKAFSDRLSKAITNAIGNSAAGDQQTGIVESVTAAVTKLVAKPIDHADFNTIQTQGFADTARQEALSAIAQSPAAKQLHDAQLNKLEADISNVVAQTVASDPLFKPVEAYLVLPWIWATVLVALIFGIVGRLIRGTFLGAMIDTRNRLSLSLFQMGGWTVLIFSLFYVTSMFLVGASPTTDALPVYNYGIWALLGLSIGSAAGSRMILSSKDLPASPAASGDDSVPASPLDKRDDPNAWSLYDLFLGEEVANSSTVDLTRLQQVIVTVVLMIIFSGMTAALLGSIGWTDNWSDWAKHAIPDLTNNETFLGLLAVSQGGYLLFKGLPKQSGSTNGAAE